MSGWPIHRAALRNISGLRKQLAAMTYADDTLAAIYTPALDELQEQVRAHREFCRVNRPDEINGVQS